LLLSNPSRRLAAFVVWVPQLGATRDDVGYATKLVPDPRAQHFWDPTNRVGDDLAFVVQTPGAAWDVYLLYGPDAVWPASGGPKPVYWMQQLAGVTNAPRLDGGTFAEHAAALLKAPSST
jgi:hypothetical protein